MPGKISPNLVLSVEIRSNGTALLSSSKPADAPGRRPSDFETFRSTLLGNVERMVNGLSAELAGENTPPVGWIVKLNWGPWACSTDCGVAAGRDWST
jgi:hypothetical protein